MKAVIVLILIASLPVWAGSNLEKKQRADKIKACFASVCKQDGLTDRIIQQMNPRRVIDQSDSRAFSYVNNILRPLLDSEISKLSLDKRTDEVEEWKERCEERFSSLKINEKYLADIDMIQRVKGEAFQFWSEVFSEKTMHRLQDSYQEISGKCYYQKNLEDMLRYFFKEELKQLSSQEMSCSFLDELQFDKYPNHAEITSPGDSFIKEESLVLFSNESCMKKDRGEGVMAHEFTHVISYLFSKLEKKSFSSKRKFRSIRKCLTKNYKERRESQPAWIRDAKVDELTTEEDFADLARFELSKPLYLDGCSNYDFSVKQFRSEEQRHLYGIYSFLGNSNPHSTPIYRLLHELIYRQEPLTPQCQQVVDMASPFFEIRKCLK